jgi:hypothetical protein
MGAIVILKLEVTAILYFSGFSRITFDECNLRHMNVEADVINKILKYNYFINIYFRHNTTKGCYSYFTLYS